MKLSLMTICFFGSLMFTLFSAGCGDSPTEQPKQSDTDWKEVVQFRGVDIRCMIHFNNELYAAVVRFNADTLYKGALLKTNDGDTWCVVRTFSEYIGPMTVEGDSLYVLGDHFVYKMDRVGNWINKFEVPWQIAESDLNGDMVFIKDDLYISQTRFGGEMYAVTPASLWRQIEFISGVDLGVAGAKYLKKTNEVIYLRPRYGVNGSFFYNFNGIQFSEMHNGLSGAARGINSMMFVGDTLLAGFSTGQFSSGVVLFWNNNQWKLFRDSLPNSPNAFQYYPPAITMPTVLLRSSTTIYVATQHYGVLFLNSRGKWQTMNDGLIKMHPSLKDEKLYVPITFLEYFKGSLFAGYGNPAFTWGTAVSALRNGLYKHQLKF